MKKVLLNEKDHISVYGVILIFLVIAFLALLITALAIFFIGGR